MYHNKSFYLGYQSENNLFLPNVISAFKILVDENYFYFMDYGGIIEIIYLIKF